MRAEHIEAPSGRGVEIDRCATCGGVWLDTFELEVLRTLQIVVVGAYGGISVKRDLSGGACPVCDGRPQLVRVEVGAFGVDFCRACEGMFFDPGELGPILSKVGHQDLADALTKLE
jgi:Zn-finger nucleic acid-binding protein